MAPAIAHVKKQEGEYPLQPLINHLSKVATFTFTMSQRLSLV